MQVPGAFLLHEGRVLRSHRHEDIAQRPDYAAMALLPEITG